MLLMFIGSLGLFITDVDVLLCPIWLFEEIFPDSYDYAGVWRLFEIVTFYHCLLVGIVDVAVLLNGYYEFLVSVEP